MTENYDFYDDFEDFKEFCEDRLKIVTKDGELVPFELNVFQKKFTQVLIHLLKTKERARIIILKCRQVGGSTWGTAASYYLSVNNFNTRSMVMADDIENSSNLFNMIKLYYDEYPEIMRPMRKYSNQRLIAFENPSQNEEERKRNPGLRSSVRVGTAGKKTSGRSGTLRGLHMSEYAFWPNAGVVKTGLMQSITTSPGSIVIQESTANGMEGGDGAQFFLDWNKAISGVSDYTPIFCAWWENPEYEMEPKRPFIIDFDKDRYGDEGEIFDYLSEKKPLKIGLTESKRGFSEKQINRKLAFRRWKIDNEMGSDILDPVEQWEQEYPLTPERAFIATGQQVFNKQKLYRDIAWLRDQPARRFKETISGLLPTDSPFLELYGTCKRTEMYAIGVDVAEGLKEGDASSVFVMNTNYKQVAVWHGKIDSDLLGDVVYHLGRYFNNAIVGVEVNNMGINTLSKLKNLGYENFYTREVKEERGEKPTKKIGWRTTSQSKREMLGEAIRCFRENITEINDLKLLIEMLSVIREDNGNVNLNGKDRTVAMCIAHMAVLQAQDAEIEVSLPQKEKKKDFEVRDSVDPEIDFNPENIEDDEEFF